GGCVVFGDHGRAVRLARVIDEEARIGCELRMKREAQKSALAAEEHSRRDIEKEGWRRSAGGQDLNAAGRLDDEETRGAVVGTGDVHGARKALQYALKLCRRAGRRCRDVEDCEDE